LLKQAFPGSKSISRAHAGDIYDNVFENQFTPFRNFLFKNLDSIYACSEGGKAYLEKNNPLLVHDIFVSRLGTLNNGFNIDVPKEKLIKILTCSRVDYLKRIDKLIYALSEIKNIKIEWTHIGDGPDFDKIKNLAGQLLPENIKVNFTGMLTYHDLKDYYINHDINIFMNVSAIEGTPVSIMEALSFGIPVIATDVGATSELVIDHYNGFLLKKDFANEDLCEILTYISNMSEEQYRELRYNARNYWETYYNAEKNYPDFMQSLLNLVS
jgi:glycosyltransferase involved in cell wall biosynthesis